MTLRNTTDRTYRDITPSVSIGHCTCSGPPVDAAPAGTLAELDLATGSWRPVFYDTEGTGMDYILGNIVQQPALTLEPGATASFTFRMGSAPRRSRGSAAARPRSMSRSSSSPRAPGSAPPGHQRPVTVLVTR